MGRVSEGTKTERFAFIDQHRLVFGLRYLCDRMGVTRQGYYKWKSPTLSARDRDNARISELIRGIFDEHGGNYGSPRVHAELRRRGYPINRKRVARLMREMALVGKAGQIYRRKPLPENRCIKIANLARELGPADRPNQQWAGDVTYLKLNGKWLYLAVVLDLYTRKIQGWALGHSRTTELTLSALDQAVKMDVKGSELVFHSDRGSEYGSYRYQDQLRRLGIRGSMNRPGSMNDNVYVETFFQSLKTESFKRLEFRSEGDLRKTLTEYLDHYYNRERLHSALGFKTPDEYEKLAA